MTAVNTNASTTVCHLPTEITPEKQLEWLAEQTSEDSPVARKVSSVVKELVPVLSKIVAQYSLDKELTEWYDSLKTLGLLPEKLPSLPYHFFLIMAGKCPVYHNKKKKDGSTYTKVCTYTLLLIPNTLCTLNKFKSRLISYGEEHYAEDENPFRSPYFGDFWYGKANLICERAFGTVPFGPTHWELMTDVLPNTDSIFKTCKMKDRAVEDLSKRSYINYEIPSLQSSIAGFFLRYIANPSRYYRNTFSTAVKEKINGRRVVVTGIQLEDSHRLFIFLETCGGICGWKHGISAVRKL